MILNAYSSLLVVASLLGQPEIVMRNVVSNVKENLTNEILGSIVCQLKLRLYQSGLIQKVCFSVIKHNKMNNYSGHS